MSPRQYFCCPRQVSLAGAAGGSQRMGARALGLLLCQQALCLSDEDVKWVFIETPCWPASNCTSPFALFLFVMSPQPQYLYYSLSLEHLIHEPVLDVDPSGVCAGQIADEFFVGWRVLKRIIRQNTQKKLCLRFQTRARQLLGVLLRLFCEDKLIFHQSSSLAHADTGVASPARMDSLMPGIEIK